MNLFEYQAKSLLKQHGLPVGRSVLIKTKKDLALIKEGLFRSGYVVKAQVLAGGRGKAGGVKIVKRADEARALAGQMLGSNIETYQTAGAAVKIEAVLIAEKVAIEQEFYFAVTLSRKRGQAVILVSSAGGTEVEAANAGALREIPIDPWTGVRNHALREAAVETLNIPAPWINNFIEFGRKAARIYAEGEFSLLEINPLALTPKGFLAVDAKINLEENALFRQPDSLKFSEENQKLLPALERKAKDLGVSYIPIGGRIGCLVNGAGLAMATMDLIASHGQKPANFLDVGGGANVDQVKGAFEILLADKRLSAIFVNIFGGIMRCDLIAQALVEADKKTNLKVPLVARLLGNNVDQAREILSKARLTQVEVHDDLEKAVVSVCQKVHGNGDSGR
ncbi:MAG: ADP-forming succinate--CoA ligase subunit beta [Elusimicrobia bacterium]|nr:ADP-forming succinate--CoA ligase subunit beta [Elusimicrobiota bacterium]